MSEPKDNSRLLLILETAALLVFIVTAVLCFFLPHMGIPIAIAFAAFVEIRLFASRNRHLVCAVCGSSIRGNACIGEVKGVKAYLCSLCDGEIKRRHSQKAVKELFERVDDHKIE